MSRRSEVWIAMNHAAQVYEPAETGNHNPEPSTTRRISERMLYSLSPCYSRAAGGGAGLSPSDEWNESLIGYLTCLGKGERYWGGLLVVDIEGDPVDFAWTESVEVSRIVRPLFGDRLASTLVSKTFAEGLVQALAREPDVLCLEEPSVLARNMKLDVPLAVLAPGNSPNGGRWVRTQLTDVRHRGKYWFAERGEEDLIENILQAAGRRFSPLGLDEPFQRLRLALEERAECEETGDE